MNQYKITLEEAVTYQHYFDALKDCNRSVNFKFSVQEYNARCIEYITESINCILSGGIPEIRNQRTTIIRERGTSREITPINIVDRVTLKVQCDQVLIPSIVPHLIYDNGASLEGKGTDFARLRLDLFLEEAKREFDPAEMAVVQMDFKRFFGSIPHWLCRQIMEQYIYDPRITRLNMGFIEQYQTKHPGYGLCLGSQVSQIMAVAILNPFDHYIKDTLGMRYYVRYMDDGIILIDTVDRAREILSLLGEYVKGLDMELHPAKTRISKAADGFNFLKIQYRLDGNKTIKELTRPGIARERRRLKALTPKIEAGELPKDEIYQSMQSWAAHSKAANQTYHTSKEMFRLYDDLYGGYRMTRDYYRAHPDEVRRKKVTRF